MNTIRRVTEYQTSDGERFVNLWIAEGHQASIDLQLELKSKLQSDYDFPHLDNDDQNIVVRAFISQVNQDFYQWMKDWMKKVYEAKRKYNACYEGFPDLED